MSCVPLEIRFCVPTPQLAPGISTPLQAQPYAVLATIVLPRCSSRYTDSRHFSKHSNRIPLLILNRASVKDSCAAELIPQAPERRYSLPGMGKSPRCHHAVREYASVECVFLWQTKWCPGDILIYAGHWTYQSIRTHGIKFQTHEAVRQYVSCTSRFCGPEFCSLGVCRHTC